MAKEERTPHEQETLIFSQPEQAGQFRERVAERVQREQQPGVDRRREIVGEEVAAQFAQHGEGVEALKRPWDHTQAEHEEVQTLVNTAFEKDLGAALKVARQSPAYPRNLDLLHDVLTGEMYQAVIEHSLNKQKTGLTLLWITGLIVFIAIITLLVWLI